VSACGTTYTCINRDTDHYQPLLQVIRLTKPTADSKLLQLNPIVRTNVAAPVCLQRILFDAAISIDQCKQQTGAESGPYSHIQGSAPTFMYNN
jgi:hypothetical protein